MSLTYDTYVSQLKNLMSISTGSTDSSFDVFLPGCIDYAEQRIYRDLNLLNNYFGNSNTQLSSGVGTVALSTAFQYISQINIYPTTAGPTAGRQPLKQISRDLMEFLRAQSTSTTAYSAFPAYYCLNNTYYALLFPTPDQAYFIEQYGPIVPTQLSSSNTTTVLTNYYPDLFMAASMVFASGFQRDFGAQADNPQQSASWESQYQTLLKGAIALGVRTAYGEQRPAVMVKGPTSGGNV